MKIKSEIIEKIIKDVLKIFKNDKYYKYDIYVQKIYDDTKIIVEDYFKILDETKYYLESHQKSIDDIIDFLERKRVNFRVIRCEVRSIVAVDSIYLQNNDYSNFARGVLGVLQGGLESAILTDRGIENIYHNHTINDIIEECKSVSRYTNGDNTIEFNQKLIEAVEEQEIELSNAWELVCRSYNKITDKSSSRFLRKFD